MPELSVLAQYRSGTGVVHARAAWPGCVPAVRSRAVAGGTGVRYSPRWRRRGLMSHPHVVQQDRDALDDLGLVEDDHTEMLTAPVGSCVGAQDGSRPNRPNTQ